MNEVISFIFNKFSINQIEKFITIAFVVIPIFFIIILLLRLIVIWTETKEDDTFWVQKIQPFILKILSMIEFYKFKKK